MVDTLAAIHNVDWRKAGLENFGKAGNFYPRNIKNFVKLSLSQGRSSFLSFQTIAFSFSFLPPFSTNQSKTEKISPDVPKVPFLNETAALLLTMLPEDKVSIVHGDYKMDNLVPPFFPLSSSSKKNQK